MLLVVLMALCVAAIQSQIVLQDPLGGGVSWLSEAYYDQFKTIANVVDISYCVTPISAIKQPFRCTAGCDSFPNTTLVHQWTTDGAGPMLVSGYIAVDNATSQIYVSLRGTKSFTDTLSDIEVSQVAYANTGSRIPRCVHCRVHAGFYATYQNTIERIGPVLSDLVEWYPDYEMIVAGHSLGGAIAMLLGVHLRDAMAHDNFKVITYGQPVVGNGAFADWYERVFCLNDRLDERWFYRITNVGDQVTTLPRTQISTQSFYEQVAGEILLSEVDTDISREKVWICNGRHDLSCVKNAYLESDAHLIYFRKLGTCMPDIE